MFDTMEYDKILDAPAIFAKVLELISNGKIELLLTHIQRDEIMKVHDTSKRNRLEAFLNHTKMIGTRGVVIGYSRLDQARFGSDEDHKLIDYIRSSAWDRKTNDALIAVTAARDADVFVTDDYRLMRKLENYPNLTCEIITFDKFETRLNNLS